MAISRCGHIEVTFVLCYKANDAIKHCDLKHNGSKEKDTEITRITRYIAVYLLDHQQDSANRRISQPIITAEIKVKNKLSCKKKQFFFTFSENLSIHKCTAQQHLAYHVIFFFIPSCCVMKWSDLFLHARHSQWIIMILMLPMKQRFRLNLASHYNSTNRLQ